MSLIAIIGGTGVCDTKLLQNVRQDRLPTFYGMIHYLRGTYGGKEIIFLPRHGKMHSIPPHLINYRANILGLKRLGVTAVFATTAVGTMTRNASRAISSCPTSLLILRTRAMNLSLTAVPTASSTWT